MNKLVGLPIIAVIAVIGVYLASPLFINAVVDEALPTTILIENQGEATTLTGNFVGAGDGIHDVEGMASVLAVNDGLAEHRILRLENFRSTNGPDLYVYLSKDATSIGDGFVDLGLLKGNVGNQNYNIPQDVDLDQYSYVLIWCKQFSVLFGYAELSIA